MPSCVCTSPAHTCNWIFATHVPYQWSSIHLTLTAKWHLSVFIAIYLQWVFEKELSTSLCTIKTTYRFCELIHNYVLFGMCMSICTLHVWIQAIFLKHWLTKKNFPILFGQIIYPQNTVSNIWQCCAGLLFSIITLLVWIILLILPQLLTINTSLVHTCRWDVFPGTSLLQL